MKSIVIDSNEREKKLNEYILSLYYNNISIKNIIKLVKWKFGDRIYKDNILKRIENVKTNNKWY